MIVRPFLCTDITQSLAILSVDGTALTPSDLASILPDGRGGGNGKG